MAADTSLRYFHLFLSLAVGACWTWAIRRLRNCKDPARKFITLLEVAQGNFVFANLAATVAGYSISKPTDTSTFPDKIASTWQLSCQFAFDASSIVVLGALLLLADGLFLITRYPWHEPFTRKKVFALAPVLYCILVGLSCAYLLFGLWVVWSAKGKDGGDDLNQAIVWQVMFNLVLMIIDCMLAVLGYVAYQRTRDSKVVAKAGAFYLLAVVLFAARNIGNVLWDWQWGALGTALPTASLTAIHNVLDMGLFAATLVILTVLGIREREGLASPGSQDDSGYSAVAGDEHEMENQAPRQD